mmetsp:Transcript_1455/g.5832  ORF Transcript_1455/g.5832 Transcript_1455/m.5832 type:complete len:233 (-) Transcript_1455:322-1020(-)
MHLVNESRKRVRVVKDSPLAGILGLILLELPKAALRMLVPLQVLADRMLARTAALALGPKSALLEDLFGRLAVVVLPLLQNRGVHDPQPPALAGFYVELRGVRVAGEVKGVLMASQVEAKLVDFVLQLVTNLRGLTFRNVLPTFIESNLYAERRCFLFFLLIVYNNFRQDPCQRLSTSDPPAHTPMGFHRRFEARTPQELAVGCRHPTQIVRGGAAVLDLRRTRRRRRCVSV